MIEPQAKAVLCLCLRRPPRARGFCQNSEGKTNKASQYRDQVLGRCSPTKPAPLFVARVGAREAAQAFHRRPQNSPGLDRQRYLACCPAPRKPERLQQRVSRPL